MEDKIIKAPLTSEEPFTLKALADYSYKDCLITAKLLEPKDSDNSLKNLYNRFIRNSEVD